MIMVSVKLTTCTYMYVCYDFVVKLIIRGCYWVSPGNSGTASECIHVY